MDKPQTDIVELVLKCGSWQKGPQNQLTSWHIFATITPVIASLWPNGPARFYFWGMA